MTGMDKTYEVVHAGVGRGWHVMQRTPEQRHASGPYTSKAQAEAKAAILRKATT